MKMESSRTIRAQPAVVWEKLADVEVLRQCIPGCETITATGENQYALVMKSKIGPVAATFKGSLQLTDIHPGESYTLLFDGNGGVAGFGKGSSTVHLAPAPEGTLLHYTADAKIGGKIAQLGQRLVDGAAKKLADDFFSRFDALVAPVAAPAEAAAAAAGGADGGGSRAWLWISIVVLVLVIIALLWAYA